MACPLMCASAASGKGKIFGHLHIVFRDWTYEGDVQSVYKTLFTPERGEAFYDKALIDIFNGQRGDDLP